MSLPGLGLTEPVEEAPTALDAASEQEISAGSEWRFEVAVGSYVKIQVTTARTLIYLHHSLT